MTNEQNPTPATPQQDGLTANAQTVILSTRLARILETYDETCENTECAYCKHADEVMYEYLLNLLPNKEIVADWRGAYHQWLGKNGIPNETLFGWWSKEALTPHNIELFVKAYAG